MKKGQGSLEYLLILAAILAIAVVVVVVANSMLQSPQQQSKIQQDRYTCSLQGIELAPTYTIDGDVEPLKYGGNTCTKEDTDLTDVVASCTLDNGTTITVNATADGTCKFHK